jgi:hypothetical protein
VGIRSRLVNSWRFERVQFRIARRYGFLSEEENDITSLLFKAQQALENSSSSYDSRVCRAENSFEKIASDLDPLLKLYQGPFGRYFDIWRLELHHREVELLGFGEKKYY